MRTEMVELQKSYNAVSQFIVEVQREYDSKLQQIDYVTNKVWSSSKQLDETKERLEITIQDIASAEKRIDRSKSAVVTEMMTGKSKQDDTSTPATPSGEVRTPTIKEEVSTIDTAQAQLEECRLLTEIRKREYVDVDRDIKRLNNDVDRLLDQIDTISNEKISKSAYFYDMESSQTFYISQGYYYDQRRLDLEAKLEKLTKERRMLIDQHDSEKNTQGDTLAKMKLKLETDLSRIKEQVHDYSLDNDNFVAKENDAKEKNTNVVNEAAELKVTKNQLYFIFFFPISIN
jgi:predicted  nucleic acid-binding Zn-ribbon protein